MFVAILFWPAAVCAALEEWSCIGLADFYGNVAVDRDAGMSQKDRVNLTVKHIITVMDSKAAHMSIEADDAQALLQIVRYVYAKEDSAYSIRRGALMRCVRGELEAPAFKPVGMPDA